MASQRTFRLDDTLDARLVKEAKRQGRSVSNLIAWALVRELDNAELNLSGPLVSSRTTREEFAVAANEAIWYEPPPAEVVATLSEKEILAREAAHEGTPLPKIAPRRQPR